MVVNPQPCSLNLYGLKIRSEEMGPRLLEENPIRTEGCAWKSASDDRIQ
jgi:hypothetical protein